MSKFFVNNEYITDREIFIKGDDVNHIKNVLRLKSGDRVDVCDGEGIEYSCEIVSVDKDMVRLCILSKNEGSNELSVKVTLFQGLPKADKMELIIQKNVELGIYNIIPVNTSRCVVKLGDKADSKVSRWQKIAEAAAKQSKRNIIPKVLPPVSFKECIDMCREYDMILMPYENALGMEYSSHQIAKAAEAQKVGIFIGPEGGFSEEEVLAARDAGFSVISLGKRILRTETAGFTAMSLIMFENERIRS
ncbi:MAG: 16S rRNA (uracil(1498)-N(3))-methyltransferase [Clostridiales bacterium]|nr:16S rRNA (uracil(1498)-N(3))-methyltransferase [Clostridiales bacterium]